MAEQKKTNAQTEGTAWDKVVAGAKEEFSDMADTAKLRLQQRKLENQRKKAYTSLGEVTYKRLHPVHGTVRPELDAESDRLVKEITDLTHEITSVSLKIKMKKAGL